MCDVEVDFVFFHVRASNLGQCCAQSAAMFRRRLSAGTFRAPEDDLVQEMTHDEFQQDRSFL